MKNFYNKFLFLVILFYSCEPEAIEPKILALKNQQFSFQQDRGLIYFGVSVIDNYESQPLNSVSLLWYGSSKQNSPVMLNLLDDGTKGDILEGDGLYSISVLNDEDSIIHVIGQNSEQDTSIQKTNIVVYMDYIAVFGLDSAIVSDSFTIGNLIPEIIEIYAPDTITRPEGTTFDFELISAKAFDPENDINWVGFTSFWIDSSKMMNNGDYIYLYDDGSSVVLYQPNVTSGDVTINDGIYSFNIPIYGSDILDTTLQTKTGSFKWEFIVQDEAGEYSKIKEHNVFIK